jgi:hypothetical protein
VAIQKIIAAPAKTGATHQYFRTTQRSRLLLFLRTRGTMSSFNL